MTDILERLRYITESPPHEHGGFHSGTVEIAYAAYAEITSLRDRLAAAEAAEKRYQFFKKCYVRTHSPHMDGTVGFRFSNGWPPLTGSTFDEAIDFAMMIVDEAAKAGGEE